jgi:hypothetical protein
MQTVLALGGDIDDEAVFRQTFVKKGRDLAFVFNDQYPHTELRQGKQEFLGYRIPRPSR